MNRSTTMDCRPEQARERHSRSQERGTRSSNPGAENRLPPEIVDFSEVGAVSEPRGFPETSAGSGSSVLGSGMELEIRESLLKADMVDPSGGKLSHIPLFLPVRGLKVLIAGGGVIARRRVAVLSRFDCKIRVVAPEICEEILALAAEGAVELIQRAYGTRDLDDVGLAVAATSDREVNRRIGREAKARGVPVSVADRQEECTFFFPAIVEKGDVVIGLSSLGKNHRAVSELADKLRRTSLDED